MTANAARSIGARVARLREAAKLTQEKLAHRVGVTVETISRLERGASLPSVQRLTTIADALGVDVQALFSTGAVASSVEIPSDRQQALDALLTDLKHRDLRDIEMVRDVASRILADKPYRSSD